MPEPSARFTLITAARLLDGTGTAPIDEGALLIEGDRIVSLGRAAQVRVPDGASVDRRDYGASTILPGLVDAHTHLVAPGDARSATISRRRRTASCSSRRRRTPALCSTRA